MDFELDDDQREILSAVDALLARHAGAARAVALARGDGSDRTGHDGSVRRGDSGYDHALDAALAEAGFDGLARADGPGLLAAALVVERVARAGGVTALAAGALVAPVLHDRSLDGPVALADAAAPGPVRFAAQARTLLVHDGARARVLSLAPGECAPVASIYGYPFGRVSRAQLAGGEALPAGTAEALRRRWRLALAVECVGTMDAALAVTVAYLKTRRQFGRAIGSFQAVKHRLAECAIELEASRWLAREAAGRGAAEEAVATAAAFALAAAGRVFAETHQLTGAIGFTREHDLHVFSTRLQALRLELGGARGHRRALAAARWAAVPR